MAVIISGTDTKTALVRLDPVRNQAATSQPKEEKKKKKKKNEKTRTAATQDHANRRMLVVDVAFVNKKRKTSYMAIALQPAEVKPESLVKGAFGVSARCVRMVG